MAKTNKKAEELNEDIENVEMPETDLPGLEETQEEESQAEDTEEIEEGFFIDEEVDTAEISTGGRKKPGIHLNMELKEVKYLVAPEGETKWKEAIDFIFEDDRQEQAVKREFFDSKKITREKQLNMMKRIKHILKKFLPEEECLIKAKNFKGLAEVINKKLEGKTEGVKLAVKCINQNGFGQIPAYMPFVVLQSDQVQKEAMKINDKELMGDSPTNPDDLNASMENMEIPEDL